MLADIEEAAQELSRRHLPAEIETSPIGPTQHGPLLPSWEEFRPRLTSGQELPPWRPGAPRLGCRDSTGPA
jgi:hypothetical protein